MKTLATALVLLLPTGLAARAAAILDNVDPQLYRDEAALYPMVGTVTGSGLSGSGVLISDRWVLTAGHISSFKTGGTYTVNGTAYTIQSAIAAPGYAFPTTTNDVGLLYLSAPVTGVAIASMYRFDSSSDLLGREATWVGHGQVGDGLTGAMGGFEKRAFTDTIDGVTPAFGLPGPSLFADFDNPGGTTNALVSGSATPTRLEGNVTSGDSGGGVFVTVNGQSYLVGINSYTSGFSMGLNSRYGALSGAADLFHFHDWIYQQTGIAAVPEPGVVWLCVLGGLLGLVRRR